MESKSFLVIYTPQANFVLYEYALSKIKEYNVVGITSIQPVFTLLSRSRRNVLLVPEYLELRDLKFVKICMHIDIDKLNIRIRIH